MTEFIAVGKLCSAPGCKKPAGMSCPTCIKLGLPVALFCEQSCFKDYWHEHKECHRWSGDAVAILRESNSIVDHLEPLGIVRDILIAGSGDRPEKSGLLRCCKTFALSKPDRDAIFTLLETNMRSFYEATWGWDMEAKMKEIFDPGAFFLLVHAADGTLVAFSMFKFSWDDEEEPEFPVLFCYELQVSALFQGCRIGRRLMEIEKEISNKRNMWKVMLTCFKINSRALEFYKKIGFDVDVNSPSHHGAEADYEILSDKATRRS